MGVSTRRADEPATAEAGRGPRPRLYYRSKKKGHTITILLMIDEACRVCFLSETSEGKAHEKSLADLAGSTLPAGSCLDQDLEFQGFVLAGVTYSSEDVLPTLGLSVSEAARRLGVSRQQLHRILACTHPITTEMALRIGRLAGNGPGLWLRMQQAQDLWHAEQRLKEELAQIVPAAPVSTGT